MFYITLFVVTPKQKRTKIMPYVSKVYQYIMILVWEKNKKKINQLYVTMSKCNGLFYLKKYAGMKIK